MNSDKIENLIRKAMPEARVVVESDDNVHFHAVVESPRFEGKRKLQCHREVYAALGSLMGGEIHAMSLDTRVPDPDS